MFFVISSILAGWSESFNGIRVIPGRSMIVKSGQSGENTDNLIGMSMMPYLIL